MGVTVRQKHKGRKKPWWVFIHYRRRIYSMRVGDKHAAETLASELRRKLRRGELSIQTMSPSEAPFILDYARHFLDTYARSGLKRSTLESYEAILRRHLAPTWKPRKLDEITRADVKRLLLAKRAEGLSPKTVENIKVFISTIFAHAREDEIVSDNPAAKLGRFLPREPQQRRIRVLTKDESTVFLNTVRERFPDHYALLLCAFRTGMRLGELLGLAWTGVDFNGRLIEVRRSYSHGHMSTPKSRKSRLVDMSDQLRRVLLDLRERFDGELPQYVFPNRRGEPMCADNFRTRVFYRAIEASGLPRFRFHDIRHTFASLLLAQGESLHYVKEQLGHASIQTTVDIYGHLVPGFNRAAVNKLDDPEPPIRIARPEAG